MSGRNFSGEVFRSVGFRAVGFLERWNFYSVGILISRIFSGGFSDQWDFEWRDFEIDGILSSDILRSRI